MDDFLGGFVVGLLLEAFFAWTITYGVLNQGWKDEAVEKKHAEYYLEGSNANWRWIENK